MRPDLTVNLHVRGNYVKKKKKEKSQTEASIELQLVEIPGGTQ